MRIEALSRMRIAFGGCPFYAHSRGGEEVYALSPMRIAFGGRPFYAHSRDGEGVALEGTVPRWYRPPTFGSSFLFLRVARPTDSRLRKHPRRAGGPGILG